MHCVENGINMNTGILKKMRIFISFFMLAFSMTLCAQHVGVKNNLLYDATLTPNLGIEIGLGKKTTLDLSGNYNPFIFSEGKRIKHWLAQPEFRYWTCERFNGWFFGVHLHGGEFSFAKVRLPFNLYTNLRDNRYEGYYYGGGLSAGYQWMLGKRWNLEATLGVGYARVEYDRYRCADCSPKVGSGSKNYFGPTKAAVSLIYFIL